MLLLLELSGTGYSLYTDALVGLCWVFQQHISVPSLALMPFPPLFFSEPNSIQDGIYWCPLPPDDRLTKECWRQAHLPLLVFHNSERYVAAFEMHLPPSIHVIVIGYAQWTWSIGARSALKRDCKHPMSRGASPQSRLR